MSETHIPLVDLQAQHATLRPELDAALARVLDSGRFIGGAEVAAFEAAFAAYQSSAHAVGVASGTAALFLTLKALGIGPGDEVIAPALTFIATAEAILHTGARLVLADVDPATLTLDPTAAEAALTPRTRAIVPVHLYGQLAAMDALITLARQHNLAVVEDAAQAHGAAWHGRRAGQWGAAACFSFYPGKNLGALGDAGAVCTSDTALAAQIARLRDHGRTEKYVHEEVGYGERLDALQAAVLGVKLPHLAAWTAARRARAATYQAALAGLPGLTLPTVPPGSEPVYHLYVVRVAGGRARRDHVLAALRTAGIEAGVHYPLALHQQPALTPHLPAQPHHPHAAAAADAVLSLPLYPELTAAQQTRVIEALRAALAAPLPPGAASNAV